MTFPVKPLVLVLTLVGLSVCQQVIDTQLPYALHHHQHHSHHHKRQYFHFDPTNRPVICNKGQVYWCQNITTAASCGAVKHCIQSVWEKEVPIERDPSETCKICLDMVKQARDQLLSNETQEELLQVLDGTCKIIPVKTLKEECMKVMGEFAPYIVDTLASQMNPQVVCSVAGLCNSQTKDETSVQLTCNSCRSLVYRMEDMIETAPQEEIFVLMANLCGQMGSYSDMCTSFAHVNAPRFHAFLKSSFKAKPVCMLSGVCGSKFHSHKPEIEVEEEKDIDLSENVACDLCLQLVTHLKDVLIANTTEDEFLQIMRGLCKQMRGYQDQCTNLIEEYYHPLYTFLTHELNAKAVCAEINICPDHSKVLRPLLLHGAPYIDSIEPKEVSPFEKPEEAQLPIERVNPLTFLPQQFGSGKDSTVCTVCQYALHFLQQEITLPSTEDEIRDVIIKACKTLPNSVVPQCESFINDYIDAVIALVAHDIDPSQVCPKLGLCPSGSDLVPVPYLDKSSCPLCLLAFQEITLLTQNNKTLVAVNDVLDKLCGSSAFDKKVAEECNQFVRENRDKLADMVITEFTPQDACVFINLCVPYGSYVKEQQPGGNVLTNEIMDVDDPPQKVELPVVCRFCQLFMKKLSKFIDTPANEEKVKEAMLKVCSLMPEDMKVTCKQFIFKWEDLIVKLALEDSLTDLCYLTGVCSSVNVPPTTMEPVSVGSNKCLLCKLLMDGLKTVLTDKDIDEDINRSLERACNYLPKNDYSTCLNLVDQLAPQIEEALNTLPVGPLVCHRIDMCEAVDVHSGGVRLFEENKCHLGPQYYCLSEERARECGVVLYCQNKVWGGQRPKERHNKGTITI